MFVEGLSSIRVSQRVHEENCYSGKKETLYSTCSLYSKPGQATPINFKLLYLPSPAHCIGASGPRARSPELYASRRRTNNIPTIQMPQNSFIAACFDYVENVLS